MAGRNSTIAQTKRIMKPLTSKRSSFTKLYRQYNQLGNKTGFFIPKSSMIKLVRKISTKIAPFQ